MNGNGKYFTNLNAWRIEGAAASTTPTTTTTAAAASEDGFPSAGDEPPAVEKDDLPF